MLQRHKKQFAQHLHEMNFIRTPDPKESGANRNSENEALVRAVICAGLYPNVAKVVKVAKKAGKRYIFEKFAFSKSHFSQSSQFEKKSFFAKFTLKISFFKRIHIFPDTLSSEPTEKITLSYILSRPTPNLLT